MTKNIIVVLVLVVAGVAFWSMRHEKASNHIKKEMIAIVEQMDLSPVARQQTQDLVAAFHAKLFDESLNVARKHGKKFDDRFYYDEMFRRIAESFRSDGNDALADKIERLKSEFSLAVSER